MAESGKVGKRAARRAALLAKFKPVARKRLERLSADLVAIESGGAGEDVREEVARELHTLKGEARLVGLGALSTLAHRLEDLYTAVRGREVDRDVFDVLLAGVDVLTLLLEAPSEGALAEDAEARVARRRATDIGDTLRVDSRQLHQLTRMVGELTQDQRRRERGERRLRELSETFQHELAKLADAVSENAARNGHEPALAEVLAAQQLLRSDLHAALGELCEQHFDEGLRIGLLEERLRELRMRPLALLFQTLPRAVRDLARELGKEVELELRGAAVALDQRVLDGIREPLLHLVRNAVDHGIESPEERRRGGKDEQARLTVTAAQSGAQVTLTVTDDGAGVDPARIVRLAVERRAVSAAEAAGMSREERLRLIFQHGFSTRDEATELSGRGVGLDVVRRRVESLGGSVRVRSDRGRGTRFDLVMPVSMVLQRLLVVSAGEHRLAVPALAVVRIVRAAPGDIRTAAGNEVYPHESSVLPIVDLAGLLGTVSSPHDPPGGTAAGNESAGVLLVLLEHEQAWVALKVREALGEEALVHHRIDPFLDAQRLIVATAVGSDGRMVLILNVAELFDQARTGLRGRRARRAEKERHTVLVAEDSQLTRVMLAEILQGRGCEVLEAAHGREAIEMAAAQCPDLILLDLDMPVMNGFDTLAALRAAPPTDTVPVVVLSGRGSEEDMARCAELGADAYLIKSSFQETELLATLERFLSSDE
jgi:chemotaxis protein histidine kinase CheA